MEMERNSEGKGGFGMFAMGMLLGVAAGVAVGMLFAPKTGREARQVLGERTREWGDRAKDMGQTMKEQAQRVSRTVRRQGEEMAGDLTSGA